MNWITLIGSSVLSGLLLAVAAPGAPVAPDFQRDIRPVLASRCFECHGEKKSKGGLRLDRRMAAFKGGDSGKAAVVPGKSSESLLFQKITSKDDDEVMPPKGGRLSDEQVTLFKTWLDAGAEWPETAAAEKRHWAYDKPIRFPRPVVKAATWPRNGLDFCVLEHLEQERLAPSAEADRATLLRRVSLDLTGLPPTLPEVDAFLSDTSPNAYEKVVDRLLASPHYGERWARPWLDMARYADTQGYEKDNRRSQWPWRDWVINALNRNLPFDRFTIEQLAGDLLPDASRDQKTATGFHRNTMTNTEGGTDDEEFRHEAVVDRVNTTFSVWMGTTIGCAQCHNHKYDPFTTKDYYQLYAFFNNTADNDQPDERPTLKLPTPGQEQRLGELRTEIAALEQKLTASTPEFTAAQARWEKETRAALDAWRVLDTTNAVSVGGATLTRKGDGSFLASGAIPTNDTYIVTVPLTPQSITGLRIEILPDPSLPKKSLGRAANGSFVLSRVEAAITSSGGASGQRLLAFTSAMADFSQEGYGVTNLLGGPRGTGWAVKAFDAAQRVPHAAYLTLSDAARLPDGAALSVTLRHESRFPEANVGRFRLSVTDVEHPETAPAVPEAIVKILRVLPEKRSDKQRDEIVEHWRSLAPELKPVRAALAKVRDEAKQLDNSLPVTAVMQELGKPRTTHMLTRGSFLSKGDMVQPVTPTSLHSFPTNLPPNRLGLARWLVDPNNPLTARVIMNQIWEQYFGIGIVETVQDFGTQGEPPSNQKLLDWLATEFMTRGWDLKAMHQLIVTSATYRQSSRVTPELLQRDPYNRLLARGPRARLEGEIVRDQALAVSGILSGKIGGPPVMPKQPEGIWQVVYSGDKWETSRGDDQHRRGIYTFWRRTSPYPSMITFDAPSREYCVVKRSRSNTPLQALTLLNDPVYVEAAQALAQRMMFEAPNGKAERARYGFRLCLVRTPSDDETRRLVSLYEQQLANFKADPKAAEKMATSELGGPSSAVNLAELAAWTVVANVLLNLDEMITKG